MLISQSLRSVYQLHFCHACLNLLMDELAVAQCSSFVKNLEWIPAMYFVAMLGRCSIVICCTLSAIMLLIADSCHSYFACHLQTVHPFPVIFISFSSDFISSFQWHTSISKLRPGSCIPCHIMHMNRIPHPAYHTMFMHGLFTMLCASFRCLLLRVGSGNVVL